MTKKQKDKSKPYIHDGYAILNYLGDIWGPQIFDDKAEARDYLRSFWNGRCEWNKFKVVRARCTTQKVVGARPEKFAVK